MRPRRGPLLPSGERIPAVGADDTPVSASSLPDVLTRVLNNPVADRAKGAAASAATTFNERVMPTANTAASEIRTGWQTKVMPGLTTGGAKVASFFGAVSDRVRETNERLRAENETFRKVGDGISVRAATTMETLRDGTRELRVGVAELITPGGPPARSHTSDPASEPAPDPASAHPNPSSNPVHHTPSTPAPEDPGMVLGVPLETVAAWDSHAAPFPRDTRGAHWLSAAGPGAGPARAVPRRRRPAKVDAIVASLATGPGGLVPSGAAPEDVAGAIKGGPPFSPGAAVEFQPARGCRASRGGRLGRRVRRRARRAVITAEARDVDVRPRGARARRGDARGVGERLRALPRRVAVHRVAEVGQTQPRRAQSLRRGERRRRENRQGVTRGRERVGVSHRETPRGIRVREESASAREAKRRRGKETHSETAPPVPRVSFASFWVFSYRGAR